MDGSRLVFPPIIHSSPSSIRVLPLYPQPPIFGHHGHLRGLVLHARAVERLRIEAARPLIEDGRHSFDEIARLTGFGDPDRMCQGFVRSLGRTPQELRRDARQTFRR